MQTLAERLGVKKVEEFLVGPLPELDIYFETKPSDREREGLIQSMKRELEEMFPQLVFERNVSGTFVPDNKPIPQIASTPGYQIVLGINDLNGFGDYGFIIRAINELGDREKVKAFLSHYKTMLEGAH